MQTYCVSKHDFENVKYVDCLCVVRLEQCLQSQRKLFALQLNISTLQIHYVFLNCHINRQLNKMKVTHQYNITLIRISPQYNITLIQISHQYNITLIQIAHQYNITTIQYHVNTNITSIQYHVNTNITLIQISHQYNITSIQISR